SNSEPRSPVQVILHSAILIDAAYPGYQDFSGMSINKPAVAGFIHGLRIDDIQPQAIGDRQLRRYPPGVLAVVEVSPLSLSRIGAGANEAFKERYVSYQERSEPETFSLQLSVYHLTCSVLAERQLAGAVVIARNS